MAFIRTKHYDNAIQKVKVLLGKELNMEKEDDAYVVFREPSEKEVLKLRTAEDDEQRIDVFHDIFVAGLVEHNFYETEAERMEGEAVIDLLLEKIDTTNKLIEEYTKQVFHSRLTQADER